MAHNSSHRRNCGFALNGSAGRRDVILADQDRWRQNRAGLAASVFLHLGVTLIWLLWHLGHPLQPQPPQKAAMVDLVTLPVTTTGPAGGAMAPPRAVTRTAPRPVGVAPNAITPPPDALEARIHGLADLTTPESPLPAADNDGAASGSGWGGGHALADYVRAQILRRWWPDLGTGAARVPPVALTLKMTRLGEISDVRIVDQQRFNTDKIFRGLALSARNAAINASPIALPPGHYDAVTQISIALDPKAVLR
jgi:hypothetical protein